MLALAARPHKFVVPEFDNGEVVASVAVMHKVQPALFAKPGEPFQRSIDQVVVLRNIRMFVQVSGMCNDSLEVPLFGRAGPEL